MADREYPQRQLVQMREQRGWTQEKLAGVLSVDPTTISRWERGEAKPRALERVKIAKELGIPIEAWISHNEPDEGQVVRQLHEDEQPYPKIWTVPYKITSFVGRQDILLRLHDALLTGKTTALTQVISGLGGIGKTVTAVRYAFLYRGEYKAVFWVEAETREKLIAGLLKIARDLDLPEKRLQNPERVLAAVQHWMTERPYWLLILDNVEDISLVDELLPKNRRGHVLLTTRIQVINNAIVNIELVGLQPEDGALFLLRTSGLLAEVARLEQAADQEKEVAKQLSILMEGLPLALEQAGTYIREQECSLSQYLEWYQTRQADFLRWRSKQSTGNVLYPHSVATTWLLSFEKIRQQSPIAVDLLSFYAFLDPESIPDELVMMAASELSFHLKQISDLPVLLESIAVLRRYSFVRRDREQGAIHIHRLVQAVFREYMDEKTKEEWARRTTQAMYKVFLTLREKPLQEQDPYFPHAQQCYQWTKEYAFGFSEAAHLFLMLGEYAQKRMYYPQAKKDFELAIVIVEKIRGQSHIDRALVYNNVAVFSQEMGEYKLAEAYFLKTVSILEKNASSNTSSMDDKSLSNIKILLARALSNVASCQETLNKLLEAEKHARRAIDMMREEHANDNDMRSALHTLEIILQRQGKTEEASRLSHEVNSMFQRSRGTSDLDRARMLEKQGEDEVPMKIELIEQAIVFFQKAHSTMEHPDIARCLSAIGAGHMERLDYSKAKMFYQQALDMYIKTKGANHDDVVMILLHMVTCSLFLGQKKEAKIFFEQAEKIAEKNPSPYIKKEDIDMLREMLNEGLPPK